ncbi:MAG TPA: alpha/beta hydrolase [Gammaproteobacteria bacterium]|nr:alpha/beta hydrolase [Gammaproteobacteria bacterium]
MKRLWRFGRLAALLLLGGCAATGTSQFVNRDAGLGNQPLSIPNPADKILLIYNHGSRSELRTDPCHPNQSYLPGGMPTVVRHLAGKTVNGKEIVVYALCSRLHGVKKLFDTRDNLKIRHRVREIRRAVARFRKLGVPPEQIFLVGHSAGGWASLMIEAETPDLVNGVIAFSPAFAGFKSTRNRQWWGFRKLLEQELKAADHIDALVFAFPGDPYNSPEELAFLGTIPGVDFRTPRSGGGVLSCYHGHRGAFKACFEKAQAKVLLQFIQKMDSRAAR